MIDVVLLGGAPGTGKTTTLAALRPALPHGVVIDLDTVWGMLATPSYTSPEHYAIALRQAARMVRGFLSEGRHPVVLAAPFDVAALPFALALFEGLAVLHVALVCAGMELEERLAARPPGLFKDARHARQVDQAMRESAGHVIHTDWYEPAAVAALVVRFMGSAVDPPLRYGEESGEGAPV